MKLLFKSIIFIALNLAACFTCKSQSTHEVLDIVEYLIEFNVEANDGGGNKPSYHNIISFLGNPASPSIIKRVDLHFTIDNRYQLNKPLFDDGLKTASAWFPMSEFDKYYEMCKHKSNYLRAIYHYSKTTKVKSINFTVFGKVPMSN